MKTTTLKIATVSLLTLAFSAGSAFAGDGKDCNHKKKAALKTQTQAQGQQTSVLSATEKHTMKKMKAKKAYSFDDALKICQDKGVADLQACVDYKTGKTAHMKKDKS